MLLHVCTSLRQDVIGVMSIGFEQRIHIVGARFVAPYICLMYKILFS